MPLINLLMSALILPATCCARVHAHGMRLPGEAGRPSPRAAAFAGTRASTQAAGQSAEDYFRIGVAHNEAKRWEEAVKAFEEAIRLKPDYAQAHYKLGVAFYNLDRFEEAVKQFKEAISLKKDYADAYFNLGQSLSKLRLWEEAIAAYTQGLPYNPKDADLYYGIALAHDYLEHYGEATSFYKKALDVKPDHPRAHLGLGLIYDNSGRHTEAVEEDKKAIAADHEYADAYYNLGVALANLGKWSECVEAYTNALRYYPFQSRYKVSFARAYANLSLGDGKAAAADARNYIRLRSWSDGDALYMAIVAYLGYKQAKANSDAANILDEAAREYKRAAGGDSPGTTDSATDAAPYASWPYPLIQYFRHEITSQALTALAEGNSEMIEMKTYLGVDASLSANRASAIAYLTWVKERRERRHLNEYRLALVELGRLGR